MIQKFCIMTKLLNNVKTFVRVLKAVRASISLLKVTRRVPTVTNKEIASQILILILKAATTNRSNSISG